MNKDKKILEQKLQTKFFCVGGGAWQELWETDDKRSVGFIPDSEETEPKKPSIRDLKSSIRPELLQRFRNEVLVMQPMTQEDYESLIPQFADLLPAMRQQRFIQLAEQGLSVAVKEQLGMRYFEEVLTQAICSYLTSKSP